jgi:hypothetical protein
MRKGKWGNYIGWYMMSGVLRHEVQFAVGQSTESHKRAAVACGSMLPVLSPVGGVQCVVALSQDFVD